VEEKSGGIYAASVSMKGRAMCRCCLTLALVLVLTPAGFAQTAPKRSCNVEDSKSAFDAVDKLENWEAVGRFYKTYLPCDDGGIAEGVSDAITKLLASKWSDFWPMQANAKGDQQFQKFVLKHIDATVPVETLQAINRNARQRCPKGSSEICKKIDAAALSAIKESQ
jgi:hypothetical protein